MKAWELVAAFTLGAIVLIAAARVFYERRVKPCLARLQRAGGRGSSGSR